MAFANLAQSGVDIKINFLKFRAADMKKKLHMTTFLVWNFNTQKTFKNKRLKTFHRIIILPCCLSLYLHLTS